MTSYEHITYEFKKGVGTITLNRPDISNALNHIIGGELINCLDHIRDDEDVRAVIVTGAGKSFSSGGDLKGMKASLEQGKPTDFMAKGLTPVYDIVAKIRRLPKPVIAAVKGFAMGAGMNFALSCDLIIAADNVVFSEAFINIGLIPGMGGTFLLPRLVSITKAAELFFLGSRITAGEAKDLGIVNDVVALDKLDSVVWDLAIKLANKPTRAIARTKDLLNKTYTNSLEEHLKLERETQLLTCSDKDFAEGVNAFWEKRKPDFQGK